MQVAYNSIKDGKKKQINKSEVYPDKSISKEVKKPPHSSWYHYHIAKSSLCSYL